MMNQILPDISQTQQPNDSSPLAWVGMQGIDLPLQLEQSTGTYPILCKVNATVNLPRADIKGIHMSRLYLHCNQLQQLNILEIYQLLQKMITSHQNCGSSAAQFECQFELLLQRHALSSPELSGWKAYPVKLHAELENGKFRLEFGIEVSYSSTCPCSAALSRQVIHDAFVGDFQMIVS
jgi:GTP cyclohydrolase I